MMLAIAFICQSEFQSFQVVRDIKTAKQQFDLVIKSLNKSEIKTVIQTDNTQLQFISRENLKIEYRIITVKVGFDLSFFEALG